jgi:O-antigen/teichoic acid export membrane protein
MLNKLFRSNIFAAAGRISVLASQVLCIGIFSRHWEPTYVSLFALFFGIYQISPIIDFGLGFGVKQNLIRMNHENTKEYAKADLLNASLSILTYLSVILFAVMMLIGYILYFYTDLTLFSETRNTIFMLAFFVLLSMCASIFASMSNHIYFAYPDYYVKILFDLTSSLIMTLFAVFANGIPTLIAFCAFFIIFSVLQIITFTYFYFWRKWRISIMSFRKALVKTKATQRLTLEYWILSIIITSLNVSLPWIISQSGTVVYAGQTSLIQRLFLGFLALQIAVMLPIQTKLSNLSLKSEVRELKRIWKKLNLITLVLGIVISGLVAALASPLLTVWVQQVSILPQQDILLISLWFLLWLLLNLQSIFLNALNRVRIQIFIFGFLAIFQISCGFLSNIFQEFNQPIYLICLSLGIAMISLIYICDTKLGDMREKTVNLHSNL